MALIFSFTISAADLRVQTVVRRCLPAGRLPPISGRSSARCRWCGRLRRNLDLRWVFGLMRSFNPRSYLLTRHSIAVGRAAGGGDNEQLVLGGYWSACSPGAGHAAAAAAGDRDLAIFRIGESAKALAAKAMGERRCVFVLRRRTREDRSNGIRAALPPPSDANVIEACWSTSRISMPIYNGLSKPKGPERARSFKARGKSSRRVHTPARNTMPRSRRCSRTRSTG